MKSLLVDWWALKEQCKVVGKMFYSLRPIHESVYSGICCGLYFDVLNKDHECNQFHFTNIINQGCTFHKTFQEINRTWRLASEMMRQNECHS